MYFSPKMVESKKLMVPLESTWTCSTPTKKLALVNRLQMFQTNSCICQNLSEWICRKIWSWRHSNFVANLQACFFWWISYMRRHVTSWLFLCSDMLCWFCSPQVLLAYFYTFAPNNMMFTACLPQHSQNPTRTNRSSGLIRNSYLLN
jgi:hypothetical protein